MKQVILRGLPASPGTWVGQAVVAERTDENVGVGAVLVIKNSSLDWLEAMTHAAAVVTEVGGRTSHAATISRELGKPCVTGVANITAIVTTGQWLAVDGGAGIVTILPS